MSKAIVKFKGEVVGTIFQNKDGIFFEYDSQFIINDRELFPIVLPIESGTIKAKPELGPKESFLGLHGPFSDSLPGRFGNELLKKYFSEKGMQIR